jgi:hypothetical protein
MSSELVNRGGRPDGANSEGFMMDRSLEWYKVVGIELVLFVGILVPLVYGALTAR